MRIQDAQALAIKILLAKIASTPKFYGETKSFKHDEFIRDVNELSEKLAQNLHNDINLALISDNAGISKQKLPD